MPRRPVFRTLKIASVEPLCSDAAAITFEIPDDLAAEFEFATGQAITLRRLVDGVDERRSYSLCTPVGSAPRIGVREVPGGLFSAWLVNEVRAGDVVEAMAPAGAFTPDLTRPGHHVLIAAGSGVTPMLSIAASVLADPRSRVTLLYGNRRTETVMFADEIADLKDQYAGRFVVAHVLSREPREAELLSGRLDADRLRSLIKALLGGVENADDWWLCGPHGMVRDAQAVLGELGVPDDRVHQELFYADDEPIRQATHVEGAPDGPVSEVTLTLDGRTSVLSLPRDRSILDGAQRARPDLPFACRGGVCGTCRAQVSGGNADMRRNFALDPAEVEAGYVLTCQSYPVSDTLSVDFDS